MSNIKTGFFHIKYGALVIFAFFKFLAKIVWENKAV